MEDDYDHADVFAIPELWQTSKWLNSLGHDTPSSFFLNDLKGIVFGPWRDLKLLTLLLR